EEEIAKMKDEAQANADSDKAAKEKVDKINAADSLIFQTEKQMKEYGDKLSDGNKTAINDALASLKTAHGSQDLAGIDAAMETLNKAWEGAAQEMYAASGGPGGAEGGPQGDPNAQAGGNAADDVAD